MPNKVLPLKKIFIRRMIISAVIQFIVLAFIFILVKDYGAHIKHGKLIDDLTIRDSFSQQELSRYKVLSNDYAFNLALLNRADENKLDAIWFTTKFSPKEDGFGKCTYINRTDYLLCGNKEGTYYGITPLKVNNRLLGYIIASKKYSFVETPFYYGLSIILFVIAGSFLFNFIALFFTMKDRIEGNTRKLQKFISNQSEKILKDLDIHEYLLIAKEFLDKKGEINRLEKEKSYNEAIRHLATQVAHDIRSPLAALNTILKDVDSLPEQKRRLIQSATHRINDIANNLLSQNPNVSENDGSITQVVPPQPESLSALLESILSEKRAQFESNNLNLELNIPNNMQMAFVKVKKVSFMRVISNIINNAYEAMPNGGTIAVSCGQENEHIIIVVKDQGVGIPSEQIQNVFDKGFSYKKPAGSGLGLSHAKEEIEKMGGKITILSDRNGTKVNIALPAATTPSYILDVITIYPNQKVIILDDDEAIHHVWQNRFNKFEDRVELIHFYKSAQLCQWRKEHPNESTLFLCDYELLGDEMDGLDITKQLNLGGSFTLVTSHFNEEDVIQRCVSLGCKILPKNLSVFVPIVVKLQAHEQGKVDAIIIDDNQGILDIWELEAEAQGKVVNTFISVEDFLLEKDNIQKDTPIYIDSNLGRGVKGEIFAQELHKQGFKELYLATGYPADSFAEIPWIKAIVGKEPIFL